MGVSSLLYRKMTCRWELTCKDDEQRKGFEREERGGKSKEGGFLKVSPTVIGDFGR
jgi:hypothetical protein